MQTLHTFQAICTETVQALLGAWPITLMAFSIAAVAFVLGRRNGGARNAERRVLISAVYVLPVVAILFGALLAYDGPRVTAYEPPSAWRGFTLWLPVLSAIGCLVALVIRTPGARVRSLALAVPGVWVNVCATIVAGMAIAGVGA